MSDPISVSIYGRNLNFRVDSEERELFLAAAKAVDTYTRDLNGSRDTSSRFLQAALFFAMECEKRNSRSTSDIENKLQKLIDTCDQALNSASTKNNL